MAYQNLLESYFFYRRLRPRSEQSYRGAIQKMQKKLLELEGIYTPNEVNIKLLITWRNHELDNGLSSISWNSYCRHLKAIFNHGIEQGFVSWSENYFSKMLLTEPKKRKKTLADEQICAIIDLFNILQTQESNGDLSGRIHPVWFWRTVFETFYYTGMRRNQLLHLTVEDINLTQGVIYLELDGSKTHSENTVPICSALNPWLQLIIKRANSRHFRYDDQLFNVTRFGEGRRYKYDYMNDSNISNCYRQLSARLEFMVSPHRFRHTLGTKLMRQGASANLHLVKALLGHSDLRTTLEYVEPNLDDIRNMLDALPNQGRVFKYF